MDNFLIDCTLRLVAAMLLGGIIGLEREYRSKDAGFRTHFLVALGAALFTIISQYGFNDGVKDTSRVAAQVVSGIGFLGAGLIVFQKNSVRGLTTAAGLWVTAAIGMAKTIMIVDDSASLRQVVGIALATGASMGLPGVMGVPYIFDPAINIASFLFSAAIGVIFGYFPARRAAGLNPIDALRHE